MKTEQPSPWTKPAPAGWLTSEVTTCDAATRLAHVKASTDKSWLNRVMRDSNTQVNVRQAADRRLRKLSADLFAHAANS
jgi:hypothetical protein